MANLVGNDTKLKQSYNSVIVTWSTLLFRGTKTTSTNNSRMRSKTKWIERRKNNNKITMHLFVHLYHGEYDRNGFVKCFFLARFYWWKCAQVIFVNNWWHGCTSTIFLFLQRIKHTNPNIVTKTMLFMVSTRSIKKMKKRKEILQLQPDHFIHAKWTMFTRLFFYLFFSFLFLRSLFRCGLLSLCMLAFSFRSSNLLLTQHNKGNETTFRPSPII